MQLRFGKHLAGAAVVGCAAVGIIAYAPVSAQNGGSTYRAMLMPLNGSGAHGEATLVKSGQNVTVHIVAMGLEPGGAHVSHIHGLSNGNQPVDSKCPTTAQDSDGDGYVELAEGATTYGPILVDFMDIDPDHDGNVDFTTTVTLPSSATPLNKRHIVIHGMTVGAVGAGTPGEVNGQAGYKTVLPVLCGEISNGPSNDAFRFRKAPS